jgi:hypothetical protein
MTEIINFVRILLGDISTSNNDSPDIFIYGASNIFTLTESNVISISSVSISHSGVETVTTDYVFSTTTNKITINASLTSGDIVTVIYTFYPNYSDTEIKNYINSALVHLGVHHYEDFNVESNDEIYPQPTVAENKVIALLTATLMEPDNKGIRLPDVTISVPTDLPLSDRIGRIIGGFKKDNGGCGGSLGGEIYD